MIDILLEKAASEIAAHHREIIDEWCKAYMAELYSKNGSIKPGDFILFEQMSLGGWKYWFEPKDSCHFHSDQAYIDHGNIIRYMDEKGVWHERE